MKLERKLKVALDESRLFILGAQVVFGFQFNSVFQELFDELPQLSRLLICAGLALLMVTVALLITPSMQHRIAFRGQDTPWVLWVATVATGCALLPFSIALAFDMYVAMERIAGENWGVAAGAGFFALAMLCLYVLEFAIGPKGPRIMAQEPQTPTPLESQVEQLLTEARIIIPGVQALLGFQLTVTLTRVFAQLPSEAKLAHAIALCCVALAIVLLMAPASLHRITYGGEDNPEFLKIGSVFLVAAPLPLAFAIALDTYVAAGRALQSATAAAALSVGTIVVLLGFWYVYPLWRRWR